MIRQFLLFPLIGAAAFGQVSPTRVGQHRMRETLQEWLAITHELDNLEAVCHSHKRGLEGKVDKETCKRLENIRDGKQNVIETVEENHQYSWHFAGGRLTAVRMTAPDPSSPGQSVNVREELGRLVQAYGKPARTKTVPYHNAYGLKWECSELYWTMPDGTQIAAVESMNQHDERVLVVVFASAAMLWSQPPDAYRR